MENIQKIEPKFLEQAQFIARGTEVLPDGVEGLALKLQNSFYAKKPLRIKLGMDPTRPDLHLGHTVVMRKVKEFQKLGHKIILIIGGATAMIGDPSGKSETRPSLTKEQVDSNAKTYFEQMSKVVDVDKAEIVNNADWLHPLKLIDILQLSAKVTIAKLMTRDDFKKRYEEGRPISVHELFYPIMQAYDSYAINSDIELGGTDQRFNVLLGRDIQSAYGNENPQSVILLPLLEGTDGIVKMSKSYPEHCISITEEPKNMYGKLMSIPDNLIMRYYTLLTDIADTELKNIEERLKTENPRDIKMQLAYYITAEYNGEKSAQEAQQEFINVVQKKSIPTSINSIKLNSGKNILDLLSDVNFVASKGEARRLISQGAVKFNNEKITDVTTMIQSSGILQSGKRNFIKIEV